jgi:hypothetical protein
MKDPEEMYNSYSDFLSQNKENTSIMLFSGLCAIKMARCEFVDSKVRKYRQAIHAYSLFFTEYV